MEIDENSHDYCSDSQVAKQSAHITKNLGEIRKEWQVATLTPGYSKSMRYIFATC